MQPGTRGQLHSVGSLPLVDLNSAGFVLLNGRTFQVASVPVDENDENIGILAVGEFFVFSDLTTQVVLVHNGKVVLSNILNVPFDELERALGGCKGQGECDLRLLGTNWISLPMESYGGGYVLLSLENVDAATAPIQSRLHKLFLDPRSSLCVFVALLL